MTAKEAIEVLEKPSTHIHVVHKSENGMEFLAYSEKLVKAFEMAIEALEKRDALDHIIERLEEMHPEKECFEFEDDYIYAEERHNKYIEIIKEGLQ